MSDFDEAGAMRSIFLAEPLLTESDIYKDTCLRDDSPTTAEQTLCLQDREKQVTLLGRGCSSSCSTSFGSPLLSAASSSDYSSLASPCPSAWSGRPRYASPYGLPPLSLPEELGTYIVYLEPSPESYYARRLSITRNYIGCVLGVDPSFAYPIHCSLSSFFSLTLPYKLDPQTAKSRASLAIAKGVHTVLDSWMSRRPADNPTSPTHTYTSTEHLSETAAKIKIKGEHQGDIATPQKQIQTETYIREAPKHAYTHVRLSNPLFHIRAVDLQNGEEPLQREINSHLRSVRVTPEGGIIVPWDLGWLTHQCQHSPSAPVDDCPTRASTPRHESRLAQLCSAIEAELLAEFANLKISGLSNPSLASGIRPKPARHTTLLNRKDQPLALDSDLLKVAKVFDRAATHMAGSEASWDMVVYELQSWGVFDRGEGGEQTSTPHDLQPVFRISDIARLQ